MRNKKYKASVLAVTLIIMAIILASALSISAVSLRERKASIGANKSSLAYQTADTGVEAVFGALPGVIKADSLEATGQSISSIVWNNEINGCNCESTGVNAGLVVCEGYKFRLMEIADHSTNIATDLNCNDVVTKISAIDRVKFFGSDPGEQTQRAIEADVPVIPNACDGETEITYEGQTYKIVEIGSQCWMAENLNVGNTLNVSETPSSNDIEKWCYGDNPSNCSTYGGLYTWAEANGLSDGCNSSDTGECTVTGNVQGICPDGWHIPSHSEFTILERVVCESAERSSSECETSFPDDIDTYDYRGTDEGSRLATSSAWLSGNLINNLYVGESFFDAVPTGYRSYVSSGSYALQDRTTRFWTSSRGPTVTSAWARQLDYDHSEINRWRLSRPSGFSVRCVKN